MENVYKRATVYFVRIFKQVITIHLKWTTLNKYIHSTAKMTTFNNPK